MLRSPNLNELTLSLCFPSIRSFKVWHVMERRLGWLLDIPVLDGKQYFLQHKYCNRLSKRLRYCNPPATVREGVIVIILELAGPLDGDLGLAPLETRSRRGGATVLQTRTAFHCRVWPNVQILIMIKIPILEILCRGYRFFLPNRQFPACTGGSGLLNPALGSEFLDTGDSELRHEGDGWSTIDKALRKENLFLTGEDVVDVVFREKLSLGDDNILFSRSDANVKDGLSSFSSSGISGRVPSESSSNPSELAFEDLLLGERLKKENPSLLGEQSARISSIEGDCASVWLWLSQRDFFLNLTSSSGWDEYPLSLELSSSSRTLNSGRFCENGLATWNDFVLSGLWIIFILSFKARGLSAHLEGLFRGDPVLKLIRGMFSLLDSLKSVGAVAQRTRERAPGLP